MLERYKRRIEQYCEELGIEVPIGFHRRDACRYVAIDLEHTPPKLIATTWATEQDTARFLESSAAAQKFRLLDFQERRELTLNDQSHFVKGASF